MKCFLIFIVSVPCAFCAVSQGRIVLNNDVYIVIDNTASIVLDNPNADALSTTGSGGNIVSESEFDVIQWNIGTATGLYTIPWATTPAIQGGNDVKIPQTIDIVVGGVGDGNITLSTYETATDSNTVYPILVTSMNSANSGGADGSLLAADRFWHTDAKGYSTRPDVIMSLNYDPSANEIGGTNTIIESNLIAQRWNSISNDWEALTFGVNDAANDRVVSINATGSDFFENWVLVDQSSVLPIELGEFELECNDRNVALHWTTLSEVNNSFFEIQKSRDAVNYFSIGTVEGVGNTNETQTYSFVDADVRRNYYRIVQVDVDGSRKAYDAVVSDCDQSEGLNSVYFNGNNLVVNVSRGVNADMSLYDAQGKLIWEAADYSLHSGVNSLSMEKELESGIYFFSIHSPDLKAIERLFRFM